MEQIFGKITSLAAAASSSILLFTVTYLWMQPAPLGLL